ncbi:unnamed protein product [Mytilus edulis]|uniref:B box-type domain-containing protein n=1 Tax=Mytilus edulis TaxID=6550 RepID=A0A8S3QZ24_MYTED|nr:unnamed protein product [Mytilus edulis]
MQSDERPALFFCINCEEAHCGICSRKHSLVKQTSDHKCFSMNMVTTNVLLTITCGYHKQMKFQYYCLCHNVLCCNKCITVSHRDQECSLVELDSNAVMERADVSERNINECLDYLIGMNMYLYHNIEEITNSLTLSELSIEKDEKAVKYNRESHSMQTE